MDLYHDIKKINAQYLRIINSSLYYQSDKKVYLLTDSMNLYDSDIYFYGFGIVYIMCFIKSLLHHFQ